MAKQYPQRPAAHQIEEVSETFFRKHLPPNWHCEKPGGDYGVDLRVDIFDGDDAMGLELMVQLKASFRPTEGDSETFRLSTATYNLLWDKLQVVMLVKYVEHDKQAYWLLLNNVPEPNQRNKSFTVKIPKKNQLSTNDWQSIHEYVRDVHNGKIATRRRDRFQDRLPNQKKRL